LLGTGAVVPFRIRVRALRSRPFVVALSLTSIVGLSACPQMLKDDFAPIAIGSDGGVDPCNGRSSCGGGAGGTTPEDGGAGGQSGGGAGGTAGVGGAAPNAGAGGSLAGSAGEAGSAGSGGTAPDAGSPDEPDASLGPECWIVTLNDTTHLASNNCLGINGWNDVETDPDSDGTDLDNSTYRDGQVCFEGSVDSDGWGGVFNLTLANESLWDGAALGVGGFQFAMTGATLPPPSALQIKYTQSGAGDFCRAIAAGPAVQVPFASAHPSCSTDPGAATPDASKLTDVRLVFLPLSGAYDVDFCMQLRAIP